ncbi:MAG: hypothetical protein JW864_10490 [Spirochaetes bacterium]|nr:hypothetical protein [Spirochaetota bacterium]
MEFEFTCSKTGKIFRTSNFDIINNKGVLQDPSGQNFLDAEIVPADPCPYCGEKHIYHANEMSCPLKG